MHPHTRAQPISFKCKPQGFSVTKREIKKARNKTPKGNDSVSLLKRAPHQARTSASSFNWLGNHDPAFNLRGCKQQGVPQPISCLQRPETCIKLTTADLENTTPSPSLKQLSVSITSSSLLAVHSYDNSPWNGSHGRYNGTYSLGFAVIL